MTWTLLRSSARAGAAVVVAVALAASAFAADDPAKTLVQSAIDALRSGDAALAARRLEEGRAAETLATRPELVHVLCDRAYRHDRPTGDGAARRTLAANLVPLAEAVLAVAPDDDRARWAVADALVLRERVGPRSGAPAWNRAADLLAQVHAKKKTDALPLAYAVGFLLEGACIETDAATALCKRADNVAATALAAQKDSPTIAVAIGTSQLWAAGTLVTSNRTLAKTQLKALCTTLEDFVHDPPVLDAATLWNDALGFAARNGYVLHEKYVTSPRTTLDGVLELDIPVSSRWKFVHVDATQDASAFDYVTELASDGVTRLRQVLFRRYEWSQHYTFEGSNPVGGDNVKSIAQGLQAMVGSRVLGAGAQTPQPARKPFNKSMDGFVFEASGNAQGDGAASQPAKLRVTGYVMRGHDQQCFAVLVYDSTDEAATSPEIEALLASLREPGK